MCLLPRVSSAGDLRSLGLSEAHDRIPQHCAFLGALMVHCSNDSARTYLLFAEGVNNVRSGGRMGVKP
jgi:hypothetical protein